MMKKYFKQTLNGFLILLLSCFFSFQFPEIFRSTGSCFAQYTGGRADTNLLHTINSLTCSSPIIPPSYSSVFTGGKADTNLLHTINSLICASPIVPASYSSIFGGGKSDTVLLHTINPLICPSPINTPSYSSVFTGGKADTNLLHTINPLICPSPINTPSYSNIFTGGKADGHSADTSLYCKTFTGCPLVLASTSDTTVCFGKSFQLTASGSNGKGTLVYKWYRGNDSIGNTANLTVTADTAATFSVSLSDSVCSISKSLTVSVNKLSASLTGGTMVCPGSSATLRATGGASYLWLHNNSNADSIVVKPTQDTTYSVKISNGCADTTLSITVKMFSASGIKITGDTVICLGRSTTLKAEGGTSYTWNTGDTTSSITVSPQQDTAYKVVVISGSCKDSTTVKVKINNNLTVNAEKDTAICQGGSTQITVTGDTAGAVFSWAPSAGLSSASIANPTAMPSVTTTYIVTVVNNQCTNSTSKDSVTITVKTPPAANAGADTSVCKGNSIKIGGAATSGNTYTWAPKAGLNDSSLAQPSVSPQTTTTYILTVSSGNCINKDTVKITVNPLPDVLATATNSTLTKGDSTKLNATGAKNYVWKPGIYLSDSTIAGPTAKPEKTITYIVTGTDNNGCTDTNTIIIKITEPDTCGEVFVPNAFSPNGDGNKMNEVFRVRIPAGCIKDLQFAIYDRWGIEVFKTADIEEATKKGWDGTYKGEILNTGVYVYYLKITLEGESEAKTITGNISLIK